MIELGFAGAHHRSLIGEKFARQVERVEVKIGLPEEFVWSKSEVCGNGFVGDNEAALGIFDKEVVRHLIDHRPEQAPLLSPGTPLALDLFACANFLIENDAQ